MNTVIMKGNLVNDVELRMTAGEKPTSIGSFRIAVRKDYVRDGEQKSDFFPCVCFGKTAENIEKYFKKGSQIIIQGQLHNDNYTDKATGKVVYGQKITVNAFDFCGSASESNSSSVTEEKKPKKSDDFMSVGLEEDLPFM